MSRCFGCMCFLIVEKMMKLLCCVCRHRCWRCCHMYETIQRQWSGAAGTMRLFIKLAGSRKYSDTQRHILSSAAQSAAFHGYNHYTDTIALVLLVFSFSDMCTKPKFSIIYDEQANEHCLFVRLHFAIMSSWTNVFKWSVVNRAGDNCIEEEKKTRVSACLFRNAENTNNHAVWRVPAHFHAMTLTHKIK